MNIILRWLIDHAWILYVACAIGALIYLVRALAAQRERSLAMFTLEHETATVRAVRAWALVFLFVALSLVVFIGTRLVLAGMPAYDPGSPLPTSTPRSGVSPPTPEATSTVTDSIAMPTLGSQTTTPPSATRPPDPTVPPTPAATAPPTPTPTATSLAEGPVSGGMEVRFGDFGALVGWELSSAEVVVNEPLVVTLYWQGLEGESPTDYTVFTHLILENGQLIAQHDGPPAGGAKNTSDWEAGETIRDTHQMAFKSGVDNNTGQATVYVGLYDPENVGNRVMTSEGQDYVTLPVTVNVVPE
jgi:hypothetical protein